MERLCISKIFNIRVFYGEINYSIIIEWDWNKNYFEKSMGLFDLVKLIEWCYAHLLNDFIWKYGTHNSWMILDSCRKNDHKTSELSNTIDRIYTCENDNLKLNQLLNKCNEISYGY